MDNTPNIHYNLKLCAVLQNCSRFKNNEIRNNMMMNDDIRVDLSTKSNKSNYSSSLMKNFLLVLTAPNSTYILYSGMPQQYNIMPSI